MKLKVVFTLGLLGLVSCRSSTEGPAGSLSLGKPAGTITYDYSQSRTELGQSHELREMKITRWSNGLSDTALTASDHKGHEEYFGVLPNGDLQLSFSNGCWHPVLAVASHKNYSDSSTTRTTPTSNNGYDATGSVTIQVHYLGQETLHLAGQYFDCSKFDYSVTVKAASGSGPGELNTQTMHQYYWYSPTVKYFVRIDATSEDGNGQPLLNSTRTLISYSPF